MSELEVQVVPQDMIEELFTTVSSDGTYITVQDLAKMILSMDESKSETEANEAAIILMQAMDDNHNDLLTLDEFSVALQNNSQLAGVFATRTAAQDQRNADAINDAMLETSASLESKQVQRLETENAKLLAQIGELERHLSSNEERFEHDFRELTQQGNEQEKLIADLTQRNKDLKHSLDSYAQREAKHQEEENELVAEQFRQDEETRDAERRRMHEDFHIRSEQLRAEANEAVEAQNKLHQELEAAQHMLVAREREHEMEVNVLDSKLRAQDDSFQQLQAECQRLRSAVSELDYHREETLRLKDQLDELRAEQRDIANRSFSTSTDTGVQDQGLQIALLQQELEDVKEAKRSELSAQAEKARQDHAKLQFTMVATRMRVEAQTKEMNRLSGETALLKHENKNLATQVEVLGTSLEAMKSFVDTNSKVVSQTKRKSGHQKSPSWSGVFSRRRNTGESRSRPTSADQNGASESPPKLGMANSSGTSTPLRTSSPALLTTPKTPNEPTQASEPSSTEKTVASTPAVNRPATKAATEPTKSQETVEEAT
eukprot:m.192571 g.192571  ORF g.192571 m.192571 type:complete len:546 (+) comp16964_c0_seq2:137-1774(+)